MKRRDFTKFAAAGFAVAGGALALTTTTSTPSGSSSSTPATGSTGSTTRTATTAQAPMAAAATAAASGLGYPFGARLSAYAAGTRPSQSAAAMDSVLTQQYDRWKASNLVSVPWIAPGGYVVKFSDPSFLTVSEGMGYGLLLTVLFAGYDANARTLFDGLLAVARARYAYGNAAYDPSGKYLMDWRLWPNGASAGDGWNALDGDLDMGMALLMADKQWGSGGTWNYLQEAKNTINAMKSQCMKADGTTKGLRLPDVSRTSDYMVGHFRAFAAATGDSMWTAAIDRAYQLADRMQTVYSPGVGLMPDFVVGTNTASPYPSPGMMGDGNYNEDKFWWNACRNPWRFASDYVLSGDSRFKTITQRMIDFFVSSSGGSPWGIGTGYTLWGSMVTGGQSPAYHGPITAGACVDAKYQGFVDTMWTWNAQNLTTGYYDCELQLLSMVVASGNWWSPLSKTAATSGTPSPTPAPTAAPGASPPTSASSIVTNGNFANGLSSWANWGNAVVAGSALKVGSNSGGVGQDIKVSAGQQYLVTATAYISSPGEGVFIGVKLMDPWGNVVVNEQKAFSGTTAATDSFNFSAPAGVTSGQVYVWKNTNSAIGVVSSISIVAAGGSAAPGPTASGGTNVLTNGGFDSNMSGWSDWGGASVWGGALHVATGAGGAGQDLLGKLVPGKKYQLTATANMTAASEGVFVGVKLMDPWGGALVNQSQTVSSTSPTAVSITFTAPGNIASGNVFIWKNASGASAVIDNVSLVAIG